MHRPATPIAMVHGQDTFAPQWIEIPDCHHGETRTAIASGFPMLCVIGRGVTARPHPLQPKETSWSRALPVNADVGPIDPLKLRALPFRPMPLGLVVNTVFWTSIVILLWTGAKWLAARMRRTPGTCPRCRYDLRGRLEDGCSECGWGRSAPVGCGAGDQATMEHRRSPGSGASTANA